MPRKQNPSASFVSPSYGYTHDTVARGVNTSSTAPGQPSESSVNQRLEYLRSVQSRPQLSVTSDELLRSTHAPARLKKRMAGPPPPRSWLEKDRLPRRNLVEGSNENQRPNAIDHFPGIQVPQHGSLVHLALKAIASDWEFQVVYQGDWLSTLPQHLKTLLLGYLARYGPDQGPTIEQLRKLLSGELDTGSNESTGCQEVYRLDLSRAFGRTMTAKTLNSFLSSTGGTTRTEGVKTAQKQPLESWEDEDVSPGLSLSRTPLNESKPLYEHLTHLSLADPANVSWSDFVDKLSPHLGNLTHLSLENWPSPSPSFAVSELNNGVHISEEDAEAQGRYRLQCLSHNTSSLEYLSLRGCVDWLDLLRIPAASTAAMTPGRHTGTSRAAASYGFDEDLSSSDRSSKHVPRLQGVDWAGAWGQISLLDLHDDWVPSPDMLPLVTLADTLHKRESRSFRGPDGARATVDLVRVPVSGMGDGLGYLLLVPDAAQARLMDLGRRSRNWLLREHQKSKLVRFIRQQRAAPDSGKSNGKSCWLEVDWGGDRDALVRAGWDEGELFSARL